jgi:hypothetical protein
MQALPSIKNTLCLQADSAQNGSSYRLHDNVGSAVKTDGGAVA